MKKIINPGSIKIGERAAPVFCKIEINGGKLSISGVEGPLRSGNARGSSGQIDMSYKHRNAKHDDGRYSDLIGPGDIQFSEGWDAEKWLDFLDVWQRWHLNDMRATCEHQRAAGWEEIAHEKVKIYTWTLKPEYIDRQKALEAEAVERMASTGRSVETFKAEEARIVKLPYEIKTNAPELTGWDLKYYQPARRDHIEEKTRGWISYEDDKERGLLSKPCEVCGYKYGSAWRKEELPEDVIKFLEALPETKKTPAWI